MSALGIYFGPKLINIVQTAGTKVIKNVSASLTRMIGPDLEEKVPEEIKIVSLFHDEFTKNNIQEKEAAIVVSGKDLIIRTFDIPSIPAEELAGAVNFEVKKYIPFKVEDLISDFQIERDKASMRNLVLFAGIKKESLEKYFSIFKQLEIKIGSIEYSSFAILRLLKLAKVNQNGIVAVVNIDIEGEDEANFIVLKDGFPLFSRDIIFSSEFPLETLEPPIKDPAIMLEKFNTELRVSMDFYSRKFPTWNIEKIYYFASDGFRQELELFLKERGLSAQSLDIKRFSGSEIPYSLGFLKAYSGSLAKTVKSDLKIDLLRAKLKPKTKTSRELAVLRQKALALPSIPVNPRLIFVAILICLTPFLIGYFQKTSLLKKIVGISSKRIKVIDVKGAATYEEVKSVVTKYKKKIEVLNNLINKQVFYTEVLDALPRIMPQDIWLNSIDSKITKVLKTSAKKSKDATEESEDRAEIILSGSSYNADKEKALEAINDFATALKENPVFVKYFKNVDIRSIDQSLSDKDLEVFNFVVVCRSF